MPDGGTAEETFEIGQKTLEANLRSSIDDIRDDIARKAGFKDGFRGYKAAGKKTLKKLPEEIRDALMALDGLYGEDGKANLSTAERYFRQSPTVMARLKTAAKRDHDAVYGATGGKTTETGASQGGGTSWEDDFFGITRTN